MLSFQEVISGVCAIPIEEISTIISRGKKKFEVDGDEVIVGAGQSILIKKGSRVRYSNPFSEECEYWSVCLPAFSLDLVHRETE